MNKLLRFLAFLLLICSGNAFADDDVWKLLAEKSGSFSPHINKCSSSEVFISIGGGDLGFCIEKAERTATAWVEAKQTCLTLGKRLPEPAEFQYACYHAPTGLLGMTGNNEWASNATTPLYDHTYYGVVVVVIGNQGCDDASYGHIGRTSNSHDSQSFRCIS